MVAVLKENIQQFLNVYTTLFIAVLTPMSSGSMNSLK
jgi:hypothetical protein